MSRQQYVMTARLLTCALVTTILWTPATTSSSEERSDLGKILELMPPNGPPERYGNVVLRKKSKKAGMAAVVFPHWAHRDRFTCRVCHTELQFSMRQDDTGINCADSRAGHYCGTCHDGKTAFSVAADQTQNCGRCHLKNQKDLDNRFKSFAVALPKSEFGNGIAWSKLLQQGSIKPKDTLSGTFTAMPLPPSLKNPIKMGTSSPRSNVRFSHEEHNAEMDCDSCHPDVFNIKQKGTESFTMGKNLYGRFCGTCHMRVAFPMNDCNRCHPEMKNVRGF